MTLCESFTINETQTAQKLSLASRRRFLELVSTGAACAWVGCSSDSSDGSAPAEFGDISAGQVSSLPIGSLRAIMGAPAVIGRDVLGVYAMTRTCTHMGCLVMPTGNGATAVMRCPCHGSQFDANGAVTHGPAVRPLAHFQVEIDPSGNIVIHGGVEVPLSTRVNAP